MICRKSLYSVLFLIIFLCGVIVLWYGVKSNTYTHSNDDGQVTPYEQPSDTMSQPDFLGLQTTSHFFVGYDPHEERCRQYLLYRCLQRQGERKTQRHRQRRLISETIDDDGDPDGLTVFDHFGDQSNAAIDQLLQVDGKDIIDRGTGIDSSTSSRQLSERLFVSESHDLVNNRSENGDHNQLQQRIEKRLFIVTEKDVRDVILPLLLDRMVAQQLRKTAFVQSLHGSSAPQISLRTTRHDFSFFEVEVGFLDLSNITATPGSAGTNASKTYALSSSANGDELFRKQWFKFVQMDKISIRSASPSEDVYGRSLMPCISFIENPVDHPIENDFENDSQLHPSKGDRIRTTIKNSNTINHNSSSAISSSGHQQLNATRNAKASISEHNDNTTSKQSLMLDNYVAAGDTEVDDIKQHQQLRQRVEDNSTGIISKTDTLSELKDSESCGVSQDEGAEESYRQLRDVRQDDLKEKTDNPSIRFTPPNDPEFARQWSLKSIDFLEGWESGPGLGGHLEEEVVVAVIDTGCSLGHGDLHEKYWRNEGEICDNGIDDDNNGYIDDCHGYNFRGKNANLTEQKIHGSPVSGAIAAHTNNSYGIAGVCWSCRIMCGKPIYCPTCNNSPVFDTSFFPARIGIESFNTGSFAEALNYAVGWGVRVINYSGNGGFSRIQEEAIRSAQRYNALIVTCSGNSACDADSNERCSDLGYPGKLGLSNIINVGASDRNDQPAFYSNFGLHAVHIFAPSGDILPHPGVEKFKISHGTSFAAPVVSGAVGVVLSKFPALSSQKIKGAIVGTCKKIDEFNGKARCPGILNLPQALRKAELGN